MWLTLFGSFFIFIQFSWKNWSNNRLVPSPQFNNFFWMHHYKGHESHVLEPIFKESSVENYLIVTVKPLCLNTYLFRKRV